MLTLAQRSEAPYELRATVAEFVPRLSTGLYEHLQRRIHVAVSRRFFRALLDEGQRLSQDRAFRHAYYGLTGLLLAVILGLQVAADHGINWGIALPGIFWRVLMLAMLLPTAVIAWSEPDTPDR